MSDTISEIISARWVLTVNQNKDILENHSVVLKGDTIHEILPTEEALSKYPNVQRTDLSDRHAIFPGLINMHTHTGMCLFRAISEGLALQEWLESCVWPLEAHFVNEEFMRDSVKLGCYEMIRQGQTCINDMYFFPNITSEVIDEVGMRATIGFPIIGFPTNYSPSGDDTLLKAKELMEKYKGHDRIRFAVAPHAPYTVTDDLFLKSLAFANEHDVKIHTHLHETNRETENVDERAIARLHRLGVINERLIAVHMTQLIGEEIELLSKVGSSVVHCPESNLKLGSGICEIDRLHLANVNVALGTDGVASNDDLNMLQEAQTASLLNKYRMATSGCLSKALPSHKFIEMATINGAKALGIDHLVGSLEVGKKADITALEILTEPVYSIANNIVTVGTNRITDVWGNGRQLLKGGVCLVLDEKELTLKAREWGHKINEFYQKIKPVPSV